MKSLSFRRRRRNEPSFLKCSSQKFAWIYTITKIKPNERWRKKKNWNQTRCFFFYYLSKVFFLFRHFLFYFQFSWYNILSLKNFAHLKCESFMTISGDKNHLVSVCVSKIDENSVHLKISSHQKWNFLLFVVVFSFP